MGSSSDSDSDFRDDFREFRQRCVANVDAAELLLTLFTHPERAWQPRELSAQLAPIASLSETEVLRILEAFQNCALVARDGEQGVRYRAAPTHDSHLASGPAMS